MGNTLGTSKLAVYLIVIAALTITIYLAVCDPMGSPSLKCPFKTLTGWDCPGCGTQRAIHSLFHGHFLQAWKFNPALFFALPIAGIYVFHPKRFEKYLLSAPVIYLIVLSIILWWILRNLF